MHLADEWLHNAHSFHGNQTHDFSVAIASLYVLSYKNAYSTCWFCVRVLSQFTSFSIQPYAAVLWLLIS